MDKIHLIDEKELQAAMDDIQDAMWESVVEVYDVEARLYGWYGGRVMAREGSA